MPNYKLVYFDLRGRAEPARFILYHKLGAGKFEDKRVSHEEFAALKPSLPFGQLPVLYVDEQPIFQSGAIVRYLGRQFNMAGKTDFESASIDAIASCIEDLMPVFVPIFQAADEDKPKVIEEAKNGKMKLWMENMAKLLGDKKYYFGDEATYADTTIAAALLSVEKFFGKDFTDQYKTLANLKTRVDELPGIKEYIATRKDTQI